MTVTVGKGWKGTPAERFGRKITEGDGGCIVWIGSLTSDGYGNFWADGRVVGAHRWAWEQANGPIPEGLQLDHLCRNRACVNVAHMELVTREENLCRGERRNGHTGQTHCKHGHEFTAENTWVDPRLGNRHCRTCRRRAARELRTRRRAAA